MIKSVLKYAALLSLVALTACGNWALDFDELWASSMSSLTAKDYVQDGLVAMWDGIENAGWGKHDGTSTNWVDLIGNKNAIIYGGYWGNNYYGIGSNYATFSGELFGWPSGYTIEFIFNGTNDGSRYASTLGCLDDVYSWFNRDGLYWEFKQKGAVVRPRLSPFLYKSYYYKFDGTNNCSYGYHDGSSSGSSSGMKADVLNTLWFIGGTDSLHRLGADAKMFAIRIYNRYLSSQEVSYNYSIDKARFGL